jgi:hypothetical protein
MGRLKAGNGIKITGGKYDGRNGTIIKINNATSS